MAAVRGLGRCGSSRALLRQDFLPGSEDVRRSPLAKKLFQIDGVVRVFFGKDFISVTKNEDWEWDVRGEGICEGQESLWLTINSSWQALNAEIFATIMDFFATGEEVMSDEPVITVRRNEWIASFLAGC